MARPRLLLVPNLTHIEWVNRPALEEWAEVLAYDAPGVGDEPAVEKFDSEAIAQRGLEKLEQHGWNRCFVAADEFGMAAALHLARNAPQIVQGLALGHARLSNRIDGERAPINREVHSGCVSLIRTDSRMFIHQLFRMTGGLRMAGGYGEKMVDEYQGSVPVELMLHFWDSRPLEDDFTDTLRALEAPLLIAQHKGCLLFTDEGFEDAVATLPRAAVLRMHDKPSVGTEFARSLHEFCRQHAPVTA